MAERAISALADDDFSPTYLRNATAYGSSPRLRADIVVNNLTGTAFTRGEVRLQSDGSPWRPLVHVADISRAFLAALEAPRDVVHDQAFNVGRDEDVVQIRDIATPGRRAHGRAGHVRRGRWPGRPRLPGELRQDHASCSRSSGPQWTVPHGIVELAADMKRFGLTRGGLRGPALRPTRPDPRSSWRPARSTTTYGCRHDGGGPVSAPLCRLCGAELTQTFVDLGMSPPCESYLEADQLDSGETFYPLHVRICTACLLVQLPAYISRRGDLQPLRVLLLLQRLVGGPREAVRRRRGCTRLGLGPDSFVVEVASNDGYLLQHVVARGIRCLGIEPAANVAEVAIAKGMPTEVMFLGEETGSQGRGRARPGRPRRRQQRLRPRARHRRLRQGPAGARRRHRAGHASRSRTCCG